MNVTFKGKDFLEFHGLRRDKIRAVVNINENMTDCRWLWFVFHKVYSAEKSVILLFSKKIN